MRPIAILDLECFSNWFLFGLTDHENGTEWDYQLTPDHPLDIESIVTLLQHYTIVTFNGQNYDIPMLVLALSGADNELLKTANDDIIENGLRDWQFYKKYGLYKPKYIDHIDVSEPAPGVRVSLKQYACRMHAPIVQDSPVDFRLPLPTEDIPNEIDYCRNDRRVTGMMFDLLHNRLDLRRRIGEKYGVDLRSKSDAQMAEAVMKAEWSRRIKESEDTGGNAHLAVNEYTYDWDNNPKVIIPHYNHGFSFNVAIADHVHFVTPQMQEFLALVRECKFVVSNKDEAELMGLDGKKIRTGVLIPPELKGHDIHIGDGIYRVGIGGLHSQEKSTTHRSVPGVCTMSTADVRSYYPSLIIRSGMFPPQLGPIFQDVLVEFYDTRLEAKAKLKTLSEAINKALYDETKTTEGGLKIFINGAFGKLWSRHSVFYYPEMGVAVTIGGQLDLLMLIERLELAGITVVSANTDGIEIKCPWGKEWLRDSIITWWEKLTQLGMDQETYRALHSRDVNNYISVHWDGSVKRKGTFGESGLLAGASGKHPDLDICTDAVVEYLLHGTPVAQTVLDCQDIRKFIRVRGSKGGAVWFRPEHDRMRTRVETNAKGKPKTVIDGIDGGVYMGRAVRWYYAAGCADTILDGVSFNKVAGSDGARPVQVLPEELPTDINYQKYVSEAEGMLQEIGL